MKEAIEPDRQDKEVVDITPDIETRPGVKKYGGDPQTVAIIPGNFTVGSCDADKTARLPDDEM